MINTSYSRRRFLRRIGLLTAGSALSGSAVAASTNTLHNAQAGNLNLQSQPLHPVAPQLFTGDQARTLSFSNLHTGETLKATFFDEGQFVPEAMQAISYLLRDHRSNQVGEISPELMLYLHDLQQTLDSRREFQVISGYRSPQTNAMLSQRSNKVAKKSLHMQGRAIDVRLPGTELTQLHRAALSMQRGGVGLYSRSQFVHLDMGRHRVWGR